MRSVSRTIFGSALALILVSVVGARAETFRKLSGAQITSKLAGMEFSEKVHWREVYERNGVVRSYDMGRTRVGKWGVSENRLCANLEGTGVEECYQLWVAGSRVEMRREGDQPNSIAGVLLRPTDPIKPTPGAPR